MPLMAARRVMIGNTEYYSARIGNPKRLGRYQQIPLAIPHAPAVDTDLINSANRGTSLNALRFGSCSNKNRFSFPSEIERCNQSNAWSKSFSNAYMEATAYSMSGSTVA